ncbi:MAG TPA: flagellar export protein FliJ [Tepidisphaeraceae bacterium]
MAQFEFQLEGVLQHLERVEKDRQRDLAAAQAEMVRLDAELQSLNRDVQQSTADMRDHHLVGRLDMSYLAAHRRYMLGMQRRVIAVAEQMGRQQVVIDSARWALAQASKEKKILEKLKEKQRQEWAAALARREAGELDELTTQLSFRNLSQPEVTP